MKSKGSKYLRRSVAAAIVLILFGFFLAWLATDIFGDVFRDWLSTYAVSNRILNWDLVYKTALICWILLSVLLAAVAGLSAHFAARKQRSEQTRIVSEYINQLEKSEKSAPRLPPSLSEIEIPLTRMRAEAVRAKQLAEMEMQRKSDLITYLAHDLKTPLASVIGYLNLLSEAPDLPPEQRAKYTGGAGLGLAIAKEITQAHGGEISVESTKERTVFSTRFPAA